MKKSQPLKKEIGIFLKYKLEVNTRSLYFTLASKVYLKISSLSIQTRFPTKKRSKSYPANNHHAVNRSP